MLFSRFVVGLLALTLLLPSASAETVLELEIDLNEKTTKARSANSAGVKVYRQRFRGRSARKERAQNLPELTENHLVIKAVDKNGKVLEKRYQYDPSRVRVDGHIYGDDSGRKTETVNVDASLFLQMPEARGMTELHIFRPRWNGKAFDFDLVRKIKIPRKKASARSRSRGLRSVCRSVGAKMKVLKKTGDPSRKVDLVMIGDGYTRAEQGKWRKDADNAFKKMFQEEPFKSYKNYFNVYRVDVISQQSGAGQSSAFSKRNALGSYFNCNRIQRLLCIHNATAQRIIDSVLNRNQQDIKLVFVNDKQYGGAGGEFATASVPGAPLAVVLHEIGHSFAGLADEYEANGYPCNTNVEPRAPNVSIESNFSRVKWRNIPGTGIFEGGKYCKKGIYRPYKNSRMRSNSAPWGKLHLLAFSQKIESMADGNVATTNDTVTPNITINTNDLPDVVIPNNDNNNTNNTTTTTTTTTTNVNAINTGNLIGQIGGQQMKQGNYVLARWPKDKLWYVGKVGSVKKGRFQVKWLDGSRPTYLSQSMVTKLRWKVGSRIQCRWSRNNNFYAGRVTTIGNNKLTIAWDDGDSPESKTFDKCRSTRP